MPHEAQPVPGPIDVSIVIPIYNRAALLPACLDSLRSALAAGAELIAVDDGSKDDSAAVFESWVAGLGAMGAQARLIRQDNAGPGAARNTGYLASTRDWIAYVDSDDLWLPWTLPVLIDTLAAHPDSAAVFLSTAGFQAGEDVSGWTQDPQDVTRHDGFFDLRAGVRAGLIGSGYFAIRREVIAGLGGFVPELRGAEDMDLFFRIEGQGPVVRIHAPAMVAAREDNADSLTRSMPSVIDGLRFMLDRLAEGAYPPPARRAIADALEFWLRALFNDGYGAVCYDILLRRGGARVLAAEGRHASVLRLLATPVLSVLRPKNYQFRWHPKPS